MKGREEGWAEGRRSGREKDKERVILRGKT